MRKTLVHYLIIALLSLKHHISSFLTLTKAKQPACFQIIEIKRLRRFFDKMAIKELEPSPLATIRTTARKDDRVQDLERQDLTKSDRTWENRTLKSSLKDMDRLKAKLRKRTRTRQETG